MALQETTFTFNAVGNLESVGCAVRELTLRGFDFPEPGAEAPSGWRPLPPPATSDAAYEVARVQLSERILTLKAGIVRTRSPTGRTWPAEAAVRNQADMEPSDATKQEIEDVGQVCAAIGPSPVGGR